MSPQPRQQNRNAGANGFSGKSLDDYVDVAERLQDFLDAYPEGSLQRVGQPEIVTVSGFNTKTSKDETRTFIVYTAAAYRTPDDPRPGMGTAWEPWPGTTPYTNNSELMNAETAAWGRAIVALGLAANRGLASRQEVRARVEEQQAAAAPAGESKAPAKPKAKTAKPEAAAKNPEPYENWQPSDAEITALRDLYAASGWHGTEVGEAKDGEQADPHMMLRMQLAAVGADNGVREDGPSAHVGECLAKLTQPQYEDVKKALAEAVAETIK